MSEVATRATADGAEPNTPRSVWRVLGRSAGIRLLVLPVSAVLGIVNTRLIIDHYGSAAYAQYGLLVNIGSLIPFADLGMSAALMNAVAESEDPSNDPDVRRVLITAMRVLVASAGVLLLITGLVTWRDGWTTLLGAGLLPHSGPVAAGLCAVAIAITLPAGVGQRLLTGLGRNHIAIAVVGLQTPLVLASLVVMITTGTGSSTAVAVIPYLATFALSIACTWFAARQVQPNFRTAAYDVRKVRTVRGGRVLHVAWPTLVQMIALPIAMQTDRIVLSHRSSPDALAQYNLASQMYSPVWQVTSAAGIALWPIFARARSRRELSAASPQRLALTFAAVAAAVCVLITAVAPWLAARASGGRVHLDTLLLVTFALFMVFQAAKYPLGMYMTDARGLRFQALMVATFLPVNLSLSIVLAGPYGAAGPVIGSATGVLLCQGLANWLYVRRERARGPVTSSLQDR